MYIFKFSSKKNNRWWLDLWVYKETKYGWIWTCDDILCLYMYVHHRMLGNHMYKRRKKERDREDVYVSSLFSLFHRTHMCA
jgi:hypothetical protein